MKKSLEKFRKFEINGNNVFGGGADCYEMCGRSILARDLKVDDGDIDDQEACVLWCQKWNGID